MLLSIRFLPPPGILLVAGLVGSAPSLVLAQTTCRWQAAPAASAADTVTCLQPVDGDGPLLTLPANAASLSHRGITLCRGTWNPSPKPVDVVFLMDNSGSMEKGEASGGYDSPPGDPFGVRDRAIRLAMRQLHLTGGQVTAGFLSFYGLGSSDDYTRTPEIELEKLQPPLDIGFSHAEGGQHLAALLRKVWKHSPNEALLPKVSAEAGAAKSALTFWSESLLRARSWFSPESAFVKSPNHAFILLSDGAIGDWRDVQALLPSLPPVYGIHLGQDNNSQHLKDVCTLTGGAYQIVSPTDTLAIIAAFRAIAFRLTGTSPPESIRVSHSGTGSDTARSYLARPAGVDSTGGLILDLGEEPALGGYRTTRIRYPSAPALEFAFRTQTTAPALVTGDSRFQCWDPAPIRNPIPAVILQDPRAAYRLDPLGRFHPVGTPGRRQVIRLFEPPAE